MYQKVMKQERKVDPYPSKALHGCSWRTFISLFLCFSFQDCFFFPDPKISKEFHQSSLEDNTRPKDASGRRANPLRITVDTREPTMLCLMLLNVYKRE